MGEKRNAYRLLVGKSEGERQLGRPCRKLGIILGWFLKRRDEVMWTGFVLLRIGTCGGLL
jgi:hypothetical protein